MPSASLSVPHYRQELPYSCVAACVRMVLAFHGQPHPEADLRQLLNTRPSGTRARGVLAVTSLGFDAQFLTSNLAQLRDALVAGTPPIVFVDTGPLDYWQTDCAHVLVVVGLDDLTASFNDPFFDAAPQRSSLDSFLQAWALNGHLAVFLRPRP
ncbi:MAG: cysteine peptidase family C39 domain-containing protein [Gemmataceae bacterium]